MPTDEQIWLEVQERYETIPEIIKKTRNVSTLEQQFADKKQWYLDTPKRLAVIEKNKKEERKRLALADKKYLAERKQKGKTVYTQVELITKYPKVESLQTNTFTQQELHEYADILEQLTAARDLSQEYLQFQSLSRKKLFDYLTRAYGVFRAIQFSDVRNRTMGEIRNILINKKRSNLVRKNISDAYCFLSLVFNDADSKTIHLYANGFVLAMGYEIDEAGFSAFIKELGGLEKIRIASAKVRAADAGKLIPTYLKKAEESASMQSLNKSKKLTFQLDQGQGAYFNNDVFKQFCLVLVHVDPIDQIEIISQIPSTPSIEHHILTHLGTVAKTTNNKTWLADRDRIASILLKKNFKVFSDKEKKKAETEELKQKKLAATKKKAAALQKRYAKDRAKSKITTKK